MDSATPVFAFEVRYFRSFLRISYETGRRLRKREILKPDAFCSDGRALYLVSPESVQQTRERIAAYRARVGRVRHNLTLYA